MSNIHFGDIVIPWVTSKDTSIERDIVEKNFVDSPPQVFELTPSLEAGSYSAILNESIHEKNESFEEQTDAILSMTQRHASELPFELSGDKGHLVVESASSSTILSNEVRESSIEIRYMDDLTYQPASRVVASRISKAFDVGTVESVYPVPDYETVSSTPEFTLQTEDGQMNFYLYSDRENIVWDRGESYYIGETIAPVRLRSDSERIYSNIKHIQPTHSVSNGVIRTQFSSSASDIEYYDSTWDTVGSIDIASDDGYPEENRNDEVRVNFISDQSYSVYRGFPIVQFDITNKSSFTFTTSTSLSNIDSTSIWFTKAEDSDGNEIVFIRDSLQGTLDSDSNTLSWNGITQSNEYTAFVGIVPSGVSYQDFARYIYCRGEWDRTITQR